MFRKLSHIELPVITSKYTKTEIPEHVDRDLIEFVRTNFKKVSCNEYRPINDEPEAYCECGRLVEEHKIAMYAMEPRKQVVGALLFLPSDAFGEINFASRISKNFVRISDETPMSLLVDFLKNFWKLEKPNLLISVIGGTQNFVMKPKLKEVFRHDFIKAAQTTGAWIITGGMNAGVMKHMGEAIKHYTLKYGTKFMVPLLGVAPWGCVLNRNSLIDESGKWPAEYNPVAGKMTIEQSLDPNHSHFLLVDNGSVLKYGTEERFRGELEHSISNSPTYIIDSKQSVSIPIVCVVLEGDADTILGIKKNIISGNPVIVVEGSGRAADILAHAYNCAHLDTVTALDRFGKTKTMLISVIEDWLEAELKTMIRNEFKIRNDEIINTCFENVKFCIRARDYMTVFRLDGKDTTVNIDVTLLTAILKCNKGRKIDQMKLTLAWNRADIMKEQIYTEDSVFEPEAIYKLMYLAMVESRVEFVRVLLQRGMSLREFTTVKRVMNLLNEPVLSKTCKHLRKYSDGGPISLEHVGLFIQDMVGGFYEPLFCKAPWKDLDPEDYLYPDKKHALKSKKLKLKIDEDKGKQMERNLEFTNPGNILFLWCILTHNKEMAMIFLDISTEDIGTCLTAQHLLKSLHKKDADTEYAVELLNQTEYFGKMAVGILNECYVNDPTYATLLLVMEMPAYGDTTVLKMAVEADNKEFVAHPACQNLLTFIWTGRLSEENSVFKLVISLFLPILSPVLLKFRNVDVKPVEIENKKKGKEPFFKRVLKRMKKKPGKANSKIETTGHKKDKGNFFFNYLKHMSIFFNAPSITFCYNCMSYVAFLILFAVIILTDFYPPKDTHPYIPIKEIVLYIWVATMLIEKIRQFLVLKSSSFRQKLIVFMGDSWNVVDLFCAFVFVVGVILRFVPIGLCERCFYAGRIVLAFNVMMYFAGILRLYSVHQQLGPKLVMIKQMCWDLFYFVIIIMVFISAYGISSNVILFPNQRLDIKLIREIFNEAWWSVYGDMNIGLVTNYECSEKENTVEPDKCSSENYTCSAYTCAVYGLQSDQCLGKADSCAANHWVVPILLALYGLITNVMMLNLLIAMFSNTYATIQGKTNVVWKMQRYQIIQEFESRPIFPPPFIFIGHIYQIFRFIFKHCCTCCQEKSSSRLSFKMKINKVLENTLKTWENIFAEEYVLKSESSEAASLDFHIEETHKNSEKIIAKLDDLSECNVLAQTSNFTVSNQSKLTPMLEKRFLYIEDQLRKNGQAFKTLLNNLDMSNKVEKLDAEEMGKASRGLDLNQMREEETEKFQDELQYHIHSRSVVYPCDAKDKVLRYPVPDNKVNLKTSYPMYKPTEYTSMKTLSENLDFKSTANMTFNEFDKLRNFDRRSRLVDKYELDRTFPMNPMGRTGMRMRGVLRRWGPNPLYKLLLTRWGKMFTDGTNSLKSLRFLEFFSVPAPDGSDKNSIPELMYPRSCILPTECLNQYFPIMDVIRSKKVLSWLETPQDKEVKEAYYFDDPRNTDNAWIEYTCELFHDDDGEFLKNESFQLSQEQSSTCFWKQIDNHMDVYASDMEILKKIADQLKAPY